MGTKITVARSAALAIFAGLGVTGADKFNVKRLAAKLGKIDEHVDKDTKLEDKAADKELGRILKSILAGDEIEVADDTAPVKAEKTAAPAKKAVADAGPEVDPTKPDYSKKSKAAAKPAKAEKPAKAKAEKAPKVPGVSGIRQVKSRTYWAGQVLAKHGLEGGITDKMAEEVNKLYGKDNIDEARGVLRNSWHVVQGYVDAKKAAK